MKAALLLDLLATVGGSSGTAGQRQGVPPGASLLNESIQFGEEPDLAASLKRMRMSGDLEQATVARKLEDSIETNRRWGSPSSATQGPCTGFRV